MGSTAPKMFPSAANFGQSASSLVTTPTAQQGVAAGAYTPPAPAAPAAAPAPAAPASNDADPTGTFKYDPTLAGNKFQQMQMMNDPNSNSHNGSWERRFFNTN